MINFASDVDGCIFATHEIILRLLKSEFDIYLNYEDITEHAIEKFVNIDVKYVNDVIADVLSFKRLPLVEYSDIILDRIPNIHFITYRPIILRSITYSQLDCLNLRNPYNLSLVYNSITKEDIINQYKIDLFVEDKAETVLDIYNKTGATILVFDRPWNRKVEENERIKRVYNWFDVYKIYKEMSK